ncbi:hypothetical protein DFJ43DRAFT_962780, partial [Lentinula guzmanii]
VRDGRTWEECVIGYYLLCKLELPHQLLAAHDTDAVLQVKLNCPGRLFHICKAGFLVPPIRRKGGFGSDLAKSYVHHVHKLGYRARVLELVYVNNEASMR